MSFEEVVFLFNIYYLSVWVLIPAFLCLSLSNLQEFPEAIHFVECSDAFNDKRWVSWNEKNTILCMINWETIRIWKQRWVNWCREWMWQGDLSPQKSMLFCLVLYSVVLLWCCNFFQNTGIDHPELTDKRKTLGFFQASKYDKCLPALGSIM